MSQGRYLGTNRYGYPVVEKGAQSFEEIGCEAYNPHDEAVIFELNVKNFLTAAAIPRAELSKVCKPDGFVYLPYGVKHYSTRWDRSGTSAEGITLHLNFGSEVGIGRKPDPAARAAIRKGQRRIY